MVGPWLAALVFFVAPATAGAQQNLPPVPPPTEEGVTESDRRAPGFDDPEDDRDRRRDGAREGGRTSSEAPVRLPSRFGRTPGPDEPSPPLEPLEPLDAGANERLIELLDDTTGEIALSEVIDEVLADVVAELARFRPRAVGPLAIRQVVLGANIRPGFRDKLRHRVTAVLQAGTDVKVVRCLECEATRTRVVGEQLVVTRGIVSSDQLRVVGAQLGVRSFLDVRFGFDVERATLEMDFELIRARDAEVMWAETYRADESTPMLMRSTEAPQTREERIEDLRALLEGRPMFGYAASAGVMVIPYNDPIEGDIFGATAGFRLFERFGTDRRVIFGLDVMGFVNLENLSGAIVSAGGWWVPIEPDLVNPELRVGGKAGALIVGPEGNTTIFQLGAEVLLRYRFGIYAYATFLLDSAFAGPNGNDQGQIGGLGASAGLSFNW